MRRWATTLLVFVACGDNLSTVSSDGGPPADGSLLDAAELRDGAAPLAWLDFVVSGCTLGNQGGEPRCSGVAPLTVTFQALSPSPIDDYRWRFGDGAPKEDADPASVPVHHYLQPGLYDVSLSASGPGGSGSATKTAFIEVLPSPASFACDLDTQCMADQCVCKDGDCGPSFASGLCAASCESDSCPTGLAAAALDPVDTADEDWEQCLCLAECDGTACPSGTTCQSLIDPAGGWVRACFPSGVLADIGRSCQSLDQPQDNLCASRSCKDAGARGTCTASCEATADCPEGSACGTFGGAEKRCIARCGGAFACDADPWLACEAPGITAPKGFTVDETPLPAGYCAPKRCTDDGECGSDGTCTDSYCGPTP